MSARTREPVDTAASRLWSVQDLADFLGVPVPTIYQWRSKRYGPMGLRVGKHIRYRPADVERWLMTLRREVA